MLLMSFGIFSLSSCKHGALTTPSVPPKYLPTNDAYTQLLAIKDSLLPRTLDSNQILSVEFIDRKYGNSFSSFASALGVVDPNDHQGVVNNNTYYFLLYSNTSLGSTLQFYDLNNENAHKIDIPNLFLSYLTFDSVAQTYYARSHHLPGPDSLVSFQVIGSFLSAYSCLTAIPSNVRSITVDQVSHKVYMLSGSGAYKLSLYNGSAVSSISLSASNTTILGLRFNQNDNFLYAMQDSSIVKIDPASGNISKVMSQSSILDTATFGAVYDQYNDQYIISGVKRSTADSGVFIVYDRRANKIANINVSPYCYLALAIRR